MIMSNRKVEKEKKKMSIVSILTKDVMLEPKHLTPGIHDFVYDMIKKKYEKSCSDEHGLIISIDRIVRMDNLINKDSIFITFMVTFEALTLKPVVGLEISFVPILLIHKGIFGKIHDFINFFIPDISLVESGYNHDTSDNSFTRVEIVEETIKKNKRNVKVKKEIKHSITKDSMVKVIIEQIKYDAIKYNCIVRLVDNVCD